MNKSNIILIGCGPHARRIYLPAIHSLAEEFDIQLCVVVDIEPARQSVCETVLKSGMQPKILFVPPFSENLPESLEKKLDEYVARYKINGVIISTEPSVHKVYALWALKRHLNILMDKPITARCESVTNMASAEGIFTDYQELITSYQNAQAKKESVFMINCQRRFHDGFIFVESLLKEISDKTQCPVTFIQSSHCDGQWRFPSEIVTQHYHPYCYGYGKASHSGYHIFDIVYRLYMATCTHSKIADSMEIVSSMVRPNGFLKQLTEHDYASLFDRDYNHVKRWTDNQLQQLNTSYGELDISALISLKRELDTVANININLIHNGFSRRTWLEPGQDLYKGNGRVKHEHHNIQQGPFQNIQIHSYQSNDIHTSSYGWNDDLGGNNHFDVYVFRNPLVSKNKNSLDVYKFSDLLSVDSNSNMLGMEAVKFKVVRNFVEYLSGIASKTEMCSQIEDHIVPVQLMSAVYCSHILREKGENGIVRSLFGFDEAIDATSRVASL